jgi:hypothetical protein
MPEPKVIEQPPATVTLDQKQIVKFQTTGAKELSDARDFTIETSDDYDASASKLTFLAGWQKTIVDYFEKPAKAANELHKWITGERGKALLPLQQAETLIKQRRMEYRTKEEQKRQEAEREAREKAKAEQEAQAVEEAKQLAEMGEHEAAETVIERAVNAPPPPVIVTSTVPKQAGFSIKKVWKFRVVNSDLHKREFLILDESKVGAIVSKLGPDAASIIGGIEVFETEIEIQRRRQV